MSTASNAKACRMLANIKAGRAKWPGIRNKLSLEVIRRIKRRYTLKHPEHGRAYRALQRADILKATPIWSNKFFMSECHHLAHRRTVITGIVWEVDHIIPLNGLGVQGLHTENNLQVIPKITNRQKSNTTLKQYSWVDFF